MSNKRGVQPSAQLDSYGGRAVRSRRRKWRYGLMCLAATSLSATAVAVIEPRLHPSLAFWATDMAAASRPVDEAEWLVRSTLLTLNDANRTGNYTVLWALSSPAFQSANSPTSLASVFAGVRRTGLDVAAISASPIDWLEPPVVDAAGHLRLSGRIRSAEPDAAFALAFEAVGNVWRLVEINVRLAPPRLASGR